ncbi:hypothetical protein XENORESO_004601 [Xenotaenia resolanae]|uniref:Uncharacterized protein n=1 Tax=Xenotaenia resolanae TaxID=208358 RepID=A0ABV0X487_9TELE
MDNKDSGQQTLEGNVVLCARYSILVVLNVTLLCFSCMNLLGKETSVIKNSFITCHFLFFNDLLKTEQTAVRFPGYFCLESAPLDSSSKLQKGILGQNEKQSDSIIQKKAEFRCNPL